tara:strand:- start:1812 stop:2003 length:192 start_codon:yes stop_codon:yes gene_type:complete
MPEEFSLPGGLVARASGIRQDGRFLRFHLEVKRGDEVIHRDKHVVIDKPAHLTLEDIVASKFA